jgi:hypothetical protein
MGGPRGLKTHAHWEQPQPQKRGWSIHASTRIMAALYEEKKQISTILIGLVVLQKREYHPEACLKLTIRVQASATQMPKRHLCGPLEFRFR